MLSLKGYPEVTLKQAREDRDKLKKILQSCKDPSLFRKQASKEKIQAQSNTFAGIAEVWHERWKADITIQTVNVYQILLRNLGWIKVLIF